MFFFSFLSGWGKCLSKTLANKMLCLICPLRLPVVQGGGEGRFTRAPLVWPGPNQLPELLEGGAVTLPEQLSGEGDLHQRSEMGHILQKAGQGSEKKERERWGVGQTSESLLAK